MSKEEILSLNGYLEDLYQAMQIGDIVFEANHSLKLYNLIHKLLEENKKYKEVIDKLRKKCNIKKSKYDYELWLKFNESWKTLNYFAEHIKHNLHPIIINAYQWEIKNSIKEIMKLTKHDVVLKEDILNILKEVD